MKLLRISLIGTALALFPALTSGVEASGDAVDRSDALTLHLVQALGGFQPEMMASYGGFAEFDEAVLDLGPNLEPRYRSALHEVREFYRERMKEETNAFVRQDLNMLLEEIDLRIEASALAERHFLPFVDAPEIAFHGVFALLNPEADPARRPAALSRLRRYVGLETGHRPLVELARERYEEAREHGERLPPFRRAVEKALAGVASYRTGLRELFDAPDFEPEAVAPALAALEQQFAEFEQWSRDVVLPAARTDFRLPPEVYALRLRQVGLETAPEDLVERALTAFAEIRNEMQTLAALVARERGWEDPDYRAVIRRLKEEQLPADAVMPFYLSVIAQIEEIIRREDIVSLPERAMAIRLASAAENASLPAPHMRPPPLQGGTGEERGTFVLTTSVPAAEGGPSLMFDDFTYAAAAWTMTAHEGRPGHELQFAAMVERGVSLARSLFAFNSVNVEGWALYAEAELKPYEPLEGQLIALQFRLLRAARAFLDPLINMGELSVDDVRRVLLEEVVLSEAMTRQEIDRYTFDAPGQAASYFHGYQKLMRLRAETEVALGESFDRRAFNDFLISQGLLPPDLLAEAVRERFIPEQRDREN